MSNLGIRGVVLAGMLVTLGAMVMFDSFGFHLRGSDKPGRNPSSITKLLYVGADPGLSPRVGVVFAVPSMS
jgi:hypothetical protein